MTEKYIPKGTHIRFAGRGKLVGKQGVTMEFSHTSSPRVKCLFYEPDGIDDIVTRISPKSVAVIEPELAYPPIHPHERSLFFVRAWDITLAWNMIRKDRHVHTIDRKTIVAYYDNYLKANDAESYEKTDPETGETRRFIPLAMASVNPEEALGEKVNLAIPSLWLAMGHKSSAGFMLIDGRNRLYKAYHTDVQELPVYILSVEEGQIIQLG